MARVLVVDDELSVRETVRAFLKRDGHRVDMAPDAETALSILDASFDVVVTDIIMPRISGLDLLVEIRGRAPDVEVILITGEPDVSTAMRAVHEGAFDYLPKPTPGETISRAVANAAKTKALKDENRRLWEENRRYTEKLEHQVEERTRELEHSRQQLAEIVFESPDGLITLDDAARIETFNPAAERITGMQARMATGRALSALSVFAAPERDRLREMLGRLLGGSDEPPLITVAQRSDSSSTHVEVVARVVRRGDTSRGVHITLRDITERVEAEERRTELELQLQHAQRLESVGRLAGGVAHDFNNLLTIIFASANLMNERLGTESALRPHIEDVTAAAERAASLTRQLLAFGGQQMLRPEMLNLNRAIEHTNRMLERVLGEDILLQTNLDRGIGVVHADPGQVEQVLLNLAINARDAMPKGGRLTVATRRVRLQDGPDDTDPLPAGDYVQLTIEDTGCGIDPTTQGRIFEPFFSTKEASHGSGLGLSTVHGIVSQSGGHIDVESAVDEGTRFRILLPVARASAARVSQVVPARRATGGTETILVVEDDDAVRRVTARILERHGYTVLQARTGAEALSLRDHGATIDLLISDVVMPGQSGREVAEAFTQEERPLKVLFMSGYTDDAVVRRGIITATTPFLQKPFTAEGLARKVRETLESPTVPSDRLAGNNA